MYSTGCFTFFYEIHFHKGFHDYYRLVGVHGNGQVVVFWSPCNASATTGLRPPYDVRTTGLFNSSK